jgi:hypothetical protein
MEREVEAMTAPNKPEHMSAASEPKAVVPEGAVDAMLLSRVDEMELLRVALQLARYDDDEKRQVLQAAIAAALPHLLAANPAQAVGAQVGVPDGEAEAFEAWASSNHYDMETHPLHWLFLNRETNIARQGWKGALAFAAAPKPAADHATLAADTALLEAIGRLLEHFPDDDDLERAGWKREAIYDALHAIDDVRAAVSLFNEVRS